MGSSSNGTRGAFLSVVSEVYFIILILRTKFYSKYFTFKGSHGRGH